MLSIKRWAVSLLVLMLLLAGGAAVWLYYGQLPKKVPLRARPVFANQLDHLSFPRQNTAAPKNAGEHNKRNIEHTIVVPKF